MSIETLTSFTCQRCGNKVVTPGCTCGNDSLYPKGWIEIQAIDRSELKASYLQNFCVCPNCVESLNRWAGGAES